MKEKNVVLLAIDPGSESSGTVIIKSGCIEGAGNMDNDVLFDLIESMIFNKVNLLVLYEDIRPFTSRFNMDTINTCKMIGRLEYALKQRLVEYKSITRNEVKAWVFNNYKEHLVEVINKRITATGRKRKDGTDIKPSFHYVNDRLVYKAMCLHWNIERPKPGKSNKYGIKTHSWSALAVATVYMSNLILKPV